VVVDHGSGPIRLNAGENLFLFNRTRNPIRNPVLSADVRQRLREAVRPDQAPVPEGLFETRALKEPKPGLYVSVYDEGHATVTSDGRTIDIGQGEAGFVGSDPGEVPSRIEGGLPTPLARDPYNVPPTDQVGGTGLTGGSAPGDRGSQQCEVR
jgi:hypothetical protein